MNRWLQTTLVAACVGGLSTFAAAKEVKIGDRTLTVADGFDVELVASSDLAERPIAVATDEQGRLYVTDSGGMTEKAEQQLAAKPHRIRRLEDTDGDGKYDKSVLFADHMMFPEGCMWYDGSLYVAAVPEILKLTDTDGDGVADKCEVWHDGKTLTGCGNDLHGPYLGRDGWFYWTKGAFAEQTYTINDKPFVTRASHVFRARPDHSGMEVVLTGGMANPVGLAFLSSGERILSGTFFVKPAAGQRDGLIHSVYGGVYGQPNDVLKGHPMTGGLMPNLQLYGAAAPCGMIAGSSQLLGGGYADQLLTCYFNEHRVVLHQLTPDGATFKVGDTELLKCDHPDFHPTDVFEDADGSVLIVDTGGWYKVCCPTSVLAKPDVLGGIYRVHRTGVTRVADPYGRQIAWKTLDANALVGLLEDPRLMVRRQAVSLLRRMDPASAVAAIRAKASIVAANPGKSEPVPPAIEALWTLAEIDTPAARLIAHDALERNVPEAARHVALQILSLWRDRDAVPAIVKLLNNAESSPALQRAAAEALGRIGDVSVIPDLLRAIEKRAAPGHPTEPEAFDATGAPAAAKERVLEHSLIYALIELLSNSVPHPLALQSRQKVAHEAEAALLTALDSKSPAVQRAALVALDQSASQALRPEMIVSRLRSREPVVKATATWVAAHRPEWGSALVGYFSGELQKAAQPDAAATKPLVDQIGALAGDSEAVQSWLAALLDKPLNAASTDVALRAMTASGVANAPPAWLDALATFLPNASPAALQQAVSAARALPQKKKERNEKLAAALLGVGRRRDLPPAVRIDALLAAGVKQLDDELYADLVGLVRPQEPLEVRSGASAVLASASLSPDQLSRLTEAVKDVGPLELPRLIPAFEKAKSPELGMQLIAALKGSKGLNGLRPAQVVETVAKYPAAVQSAAKGLANEMDASAAEQGAHLDKLLAALPKGDERRGQEVFVGKKVACSGCHAVGSGGGHLGPDLTNINKVRTDRDLLEAIVYPSASFVRGYEPVMVDTKESGDRLIGIVVSESASEIVLATGPLQTQHVPRSDIAMMQGSPLSMMPQGFESLLSQQELADLLAFLHGQAKPH